MLQKLKNKIILNMPISRKYYNDTFSMLFKLIDIQKESEMFMRNDLFHLTRIVEKIERRKETMKEEIKEEKDNMFG